MDDQSTMPRGAAGPMELLPQEALTSAFAQRLSEAELYGVLPRVSKAWGQRFNSTATKPAAAFTLRSRDSVAGFRRWMQAHGHRVQELTLTVQLHDAAARRPVWSALENTGITRLQLSLPQGPDDEQLLLAVLAANRGQLSALHLHHTRSAAAATCFCSHFSPRLWQAACGLRELRLTGSCITRACSSAGLPVNTHLTCLEIGCCDTAAPDDAFCALLESLPALRHLSYASGTPLQLTPRVSSRVAAAACCSNLTSLKLENFHASGAEAQRGLQLLAGSLQGLTQLRLINCSGLEQLVQAPQPQQADGGAQGLTLLAVTRSLQDGFLPGSLACWGRPNSDSDSDSSSSSEGSSDATGSDEEDSGSCSVFGGAAASSGSEAASAGWSSAGPSSPSSCNSMAVDAPRGTAGALLRVSRSSHPCRACGASPAHGSPCCAAGARKPLSSANYKLPWPVSEWKTVTKCAFPVV